MDELWYEVGGKKYVASKRSSQCFVSAGLRGHVDKDKVCCSKIKYAGVVVVLVGFLAFGGLVLPWKVGVLRSLSGYLIEKI